MREALVRLFCKRSDLLVVGQSGHAEGTGRHVLDSHCDVLVFDSLQTEWLPAILLSPVETMLLLEPS